MNFKRIIAGITAVIMIGTGFNFGDYKVLKDCCAVVGAEETVKQIGTYEINFETETENAYWLEFTAEEDGVYTFQTTSDFDTIGYLYTYRPEDDNSDDWDQKDDDGGEGYNFKITRNIYKGETIYLKVSSFSIGICNLEITMSEMSNYELYTNFPSEYMGDEDKIIDGDVVYIKNEDGKTLSVYGCKFSAENIVIPSTVEGYTVTKINGFSRYSGYGGHEENSRLKSVILPDTTVDIIDGAFDNCTALKEIIIPEGVKTIGEASGYYISGAFRNCVSLEKVSLPSTLTLIGLNTFRNCESLKELEIPVSVTYVGENALNGTGLKTEEINGIKVYDGWIVESNIENLDNNEYIIPDGIKQIPNLPNTITNVTIPESIAEIGYAAFGLTDFHNGDAYPYRYYNLSDVTIKGNNLKSVGDYAFSSCDSLVTIKLPDSLKSIGTYAFAFSGLRNINLPESLEEIKFGAFANTSLNSVIVPSNIKKIEYSGLGEVSSAVIPATIEELDTGAFRPYMYGASATKGYRPTVYFMGSEQQLIDSLVVYSEYSDERDTIEKADAIPENWNVYYNCEVVEQDGMKFVVTDNSAVLYRCNQDVNQVTIPAEINGVPVTSIEAGAFYGCGLITKLVIPDNIKKIGDDAFDYCSSLESITFPKNIELPEISESSITNEDEYNENSVTNGFEDLFDGCSSLKEVILDENDENYFFAEGAVYSKNPQKLIMVPMGATELTILDGTTEIAYRAVEDCRNIKTWNGIPESVKRIGKYAFRNSGFEKVIIPDTVTEISGYAFAVMPDLKEAVLPDNMEYIPNNMFGGDINLTRVNIPESVKVIGSETFWDCTSLRDVYIPASVEKIGSYLFSYESGESHLITTMPNIRIFGEEGSVAENYANTYHIKFIINGSTEIRTDDFEEKEYENLRYAISGDGSLVITGCDKEATEVVIPDEIDGIAVTEIDPYAFYSCDELTSVSLPESIKKIGASAFKSCGALKEINIPEKITEIPNNLFEDCEVLTEITIPDGVTKIGKNAFDDCYNLKNVVLPDSVTTIGESAFNGCSALESIVIPEGVTEIKNSTFSYCKSLAEIDIPNGVTKIGANAFNSCSVIKVPSSVTSLGRNSIAKTVYYDGTKEDWMKLIEENKADCDESGNIKIYQVIFNDETSLSVHYGEEGEFSFKNAYGKIKITGYNPENEVPEVIEVPAELDGGEVTELGYELFYSSNGKFKNVKEVVLPDTIENIEDRVFSGMSNLEKLELPAALKSIGESVFYNCSGLTGITLPDGITAIKHGTFYNCSSLEKIDIPDSVTLLGESAFQGCSALTSVKISDGVKLINGSSFEGCSSLTSVKIPDSVESISYSAFAECSNLKEIIIPDSLTKISSSAFFNTPWYENQPDGLICINKLCYTYKGEMPENCEVTIPENVTLIGESAFFNCTSLKTVTVSESVTAIDNYAFAECNNLTTITIPESVTSIADLAFLRCEKLTIKGYKGSYAEKFASQNKIPFVALEKEADEIILGDVNDDGVVSVADIITLMRYILCAEETVINKSNADINSDEKINVMDLLALKKMFLA